MVGLAARAQGRTGGRPTVMNPDKLAAARARRVSGESPTQIARAGELCELSELAAAGVRAATRRVARKSAGYAYEPAMICVWPLSQEGAAGPVPAAFTCYCRAG